MATPAAFVPVDQVIATAKSIMEGADSIDRAFIKEWVALGLQEIGPNLAWFGDATLYPADNSLRKPTDMQQALDLALYDSQGAELRYVLRGKGERIHASDNSLRNDGTYAPGFGAPIDLSEDQYYYNIGSQGAAVAYAKLKYFRFPTDENGDIMVPESDVFALATFIKYMWYWRKDDKQGIALMHPIWISRRNEAGANHNIPSQLDAAEIARAFNSMIQKQRFKQF